MPGVWFFLLFLFVVLQGKFPDELFTKSLHRIRGYGRRRRTELSGGVGSHTRSQSSIHGGGRAGLLLLLLLLLPEPEPCYPLLRCPRAVSLYPPPPCRLIATVLDHALLEKG